MTMPLAALLLALASTEVTLAAAERLPAVKAGQLLLSGQDHGPIQAVVRVPVQNLDPPGHIEIDLIEQPVLGSEGCQRKRWRASFRQAPGASPGDAVFESASASREVALVRGRTCFGAAFVRLHPNMAPAAALGALRNLNTIIHGEKRFDLACSDQTSSGLCRDADTIRSDLAQLRPWAVSLKDGDTVIWLGTPGQLVTEVRFGPGNKVSIERRIPAPA